MTSSDLSGNFKDNQDHIAFLSGPIRKIFSKNCLKNYSSTGTPRFEQLMGTEQDEFLFQ